MIPLTKKNWIKLSASVLATRINVVFYECNNHFCHHDKKIFLTLKKWSQKMRCSSSAQRAPIIPDVMTHDRLITQIITWQLEHWYFDINRISDINYCCYRQVVPTHTGKKIRSIRKKYLSLWRWTCWTPVTALISIGQQRLTVCDILYQYSTFRFLLMLISTAVLSPRLASSSFTQRKNRKVAGRRSVRRGRESWF